MTHLLNSIKNFIKWLWLGIRRPKLIPKIVSYHLNKVEIYSITSITPGRYHAWLESSVGRIRKPINQIPVHAKRKWNQEIERRINSTEIPFVLPTV